MKLLTAATTKAFQKFPLRSQEGKFFEAKVVAKFFMPSGRFTFLATEGSPLPNGDFEFFGFCVSALGSDCDEWGYTTLSQLKSAKGMFGLGMERDLSVAPGKRTAGSLLGI